MRHGTPLNERSRDPSEMGKGFVIDKPAGELTAKRSTLSLINGLSNVWLALICLTAGVSISPKLNRTTFSLICPSKRSGPLIDPVRDPSETGKGFVKPAGELTAEPSTLSLTNSLSNECFALICLTAGVFTSPQLW